MSWNSQNCEPEQTFLLYKLIISETCYHGVRLTNIIVLLSVCEENKTIYLYEKEEWENNINQNISGKYL